ncbi:MAG: hypothetical protein EOP07_05160 [Proteobacteria bacterium]|nr:MAG: hypothetical protein EOP07_05160 [Pseudomonadota bacterium]
MNRLRAALGFLLMFVSHPVFACAVCGAGENDPTRNAYTGSTAFLSVVPLMAMGGIVYTVYRYVKRADEE